MIGTLSIIESNERQIHAASEFAIIKLFDIEASLLKAASEEFQAACLKIITNHRDAKKMLQDIMLEQLSVVLDSETTDQQAIQASAEFARESSAIGLRLRSGCSFEGFSETRATPELQQKINDDVVTLVRGNMVPHTGKKVGPK